MLHALIMVGGGGTRRKRIGNCESKDQSILVQLNWKNLFFAVSMLKGKTTVYGKEKRGLDFSLPKS